MGLEFFEFHVWMMTENGIFWSSIGSSPISFRVKKSLIVKCSDAPSGLFGYYELYSAVVKLKHVGDGKMIDLDFHPKSGKTKAKA